MGKRVMSLYVEDNSIRLLVANDRQVERWASIPLEPGLVSGGAIVDETQVTNKIKELFTIIKSAPPAAAT